MNEIIPNFPEGKGQRFIERSGELFSENSDLNVDALVSYIHSTAFENEATIREMLSRYRVGRRENMNDIYMNMTHIIDMWLLREKLSLGKPMSKSEWLERFEEWVKAVHEKKKTITVDGTVVEVDERDYILEPASGIRPEVCAQITLNALDGKKYDIRIVRVHNARRKFHYDYILDDVPAAPEEGTEKPAE